MAFRTTVIPSEESKETVNNKLESDMLSREQSKHIINTGTCSTIQPDTSISTPNRSQKRKSMTTELKKEEQSEKDDLEITNISSFTFPDVQMLFPSIPMIGTQNSLGLPYYFNTQNKLQTMEDNDSENGETKRGKSPVDVTLFKFGPLFSPISTFASQSSEAYPQFYNSHIPPTHSNNIPQSYSQFSEYNALQQFQHAISSSSTGNGAPIDHEASLYRMAGSNSNYINSYNIHQNSLQPNNLIESFGYQDIIPEDDFHFPGVQDVNEDLDPIVPINSNRHNSVASVKKPDTNQTTGNYNRIRATSYESNATNSSSRGKIFRVPSGDERKTTEGKRRSKRSAAMRRRVSTSETEELTESFGLSDEEYMSDVSDHDRSFTKRQRSNTMATAISNSNEMLAEVLEQSGIDSKKPNKRVYIVRKNIDPENLKKIDAIRKEDKRRKNRELAAKSRTKKKARMDYLEQQVRDLVSQNNGLKSEVTGLKRKVELCTCQHNNSSSN